MPIYSERHSGTGWRATIREIFLEPRFLRFSLLFLTLLAGCIISFILGSPVWLGITLAILTFSAGIGVVNSVINFGIHSAHASIRDELTSQQTRPVQTFANQAVSNAELSMDPIRTDKIFPFRDQFNAISQTLNLVELDIDGVELCREIQASNQPERLISEKLDSLGVHQKMLLLTQEKSGYIGNAVSLPETTLWWLLLESELEKNQLILKSLFKGLSSVQCIYVINRSYETSSLGALNVMPATLEILFENITLEDRLKFLSMTIDRGMAEGAVWAVPVLKVVSKERHETVETVLDAAVRHENGALANLLIQYGAIEANPECDFQALVQCPGIDIMPFRDKLKITLQAANCLKADVIENLVIDCLVGETASKIEVRPL